MDKKEKVLLGIQYCVCGESCDGCPYKGEHWHAECIDELLLDAKELITEEK